MYETHGRANYRTGRHRTVAYELLPSQAGVQFLNRLPNSIKDATTPKVFKTRLKRFLVSQAFYNAYLANKIREFLIRLQLNIENCVSQSFEGASVMSGEFSGLQALIRQLTINLCPYIHCHAHSLTQAPCRSPKIFLSPLQFPVTIKDKNQIKTNYQRLCVVKVKNWVHHRIVDQIPGWNLMKHIITGLEGKENLLRVVLCLPQNGLSVIPIGIKLIQFETSRYSSGPTQNSQVSSSKDGYDNF
ncbi:zinc finger, MYM-type [Homalodisca vitripennis]|nr:zinc finger, MYM-type [Homalodisca vitripennis]